MRRNRRTHDFQKLEEATRLRQQSPPRIRDNWITLAAGLLTIFFGILIIILNEARAVATTRALEESVASVEDVNANEEIDNSLVGRLIYLTGEIYVHEPVTDPEYGISVPAVKLKRRIQMFQWIEEELKESVPGEPPMSKFLYFTDWRDRLINSAAFQNPVNHENPKDFPVKTQTLINDKVTLGKFELGKELKERFHHFDEITSDERPENKDVKLHSGLYYHAQDIWNPDIGDLRIQFSYAGMHGQVISVIGKIDNHNRIVPYRTNLGSNILLMRLGQVPKEDIFFDEEAWSRCIGWTYRFISWFLLYIGSVCMSRIFNILCQQSGTLPDSVPSTKLAMSASIYLLVTAFAWIWYKPSLGLALVVTMLVIMYWAGVFTEPHMNTAKALVAIQAAQAAQTTQGAHANPSARVPRVTRPLRPPYSMHRYNRL